MTKIDELSSKALARAVAEARGLVLARGSAEYWTRGGHFAYGTHEYRPDREIEQAWELDDDNWYWRFEDYPDAVLATIQCKREDGYIYFLTEAWADFADHGTKAAAYATARCRAYLKAKEIPDD